MLPTSRLPLPSFTAFTAFVVLILTHIQSTIASPTTIHRIANHVTSDSTAQMPILSSPPTSCSPPSSNDRTRPNVPQDSVVEIFIMSKCPDAHFTTSLFSKILPRLNHQRKNKEPVRVRLEFMTDDEGRCMHGEAECVGNQLLLALQSPSKWLPSTNSSSFPSDSDFKAEIESAKHDIASEKEEKEEEKKWDGKGEFPILAFLEEYNASPSLIGDLHHLPTSALHNYLTRPQLTSLITFVRRHGPELLSESAGYVRGLGIKVSATVRVEGCVVGVRDGGAWRELSEGLGVDGAGEVSVDAWVEFLARVFA